MKALILCAGYGTRLGELTKEIPKPMLPLNGIPMLSYILSNCKLNGFTDIAINLHFRPEIITEYFGDGSKFGLSIQYFYEDRLLGTAGSVRNMRSFLGETPEFLVHYGDIVTDQNFSKMCAFHKSKPDALATLLVHSRPNSNSIVIIDRTQKITGFVERPTDEERKQFNSTFVNSGVAIFNRNIIDHIGNDAVDLPKDIYCKLFRDYNLYAYQLESFRSAIDSPERYHAAEDALLTGRCASKPLSIIK